MEHKFDLAQTAIVFFKDRQPIIVQGNVLKEDVCDLIAELSYDLVNTHPKSGFHRVNKGQEGEGIAFGHRWCGQDGYQE